MTTRRAVRYSLGTLAMLWLAVTTAQPAGDSDAEARDLAQCAAYYYNAAKAKPMAEYEDLFSAGEQSFNRAAHVLGIETAGRVMGDAAAEMTATIGNDWQNFARIDARFDRHCNELLDMQNK